MTEKVTISEVIKKYMKGERDFSNIKASGNFSNIDLRGAIFQGADLSNCDFSHSDLTGADFSFSKLTRCHFVGSILKNTKFDNADMKWAVLKKSFLDNTSFRSTNLEWAHLCRNDITQADIKNAILSWSCLIDSSISEEQKTDLEDTTMTSIGSISIGKDVEKIDNVYAIESPGEYKMQTTEDIIQKGYKLKSFSDNKERKEWC